MSQQQESVEERVAGATTVDKTDRVDCASVLSEPVRTLAVELTKRDSFSDSGAEGSGNNTPTRGRTYTEGLLRFVQDTSLQQKPERKTSNIEQPTVYNNQPQQQQQPPPPAAPQTAAHVSCCGRPDGCRWWRWWWRC